MQLLNPAREAGQLWHHRGCARTGLRPPA